MQLTVLVWSYPAVVHFVVKGAMIQVYLLVYRQRFLSVLNLSRPNYHVSESWCMCC